MSISRARAGLLGMSIALLAAAPGDSQAALDIAQAPLFVSVPVDPNLMFVLDDSGSMQFETIPEETTVYRFGTEEWWNRAVLYVYPMRQATGTPAGVEYEDCIYRAVADTGCDYWRSATYRGARLHVIPDFASTNRWAAYFRSARNNPMYYDPSVRYRPWVDSAGAEWPAASPTQAYHNPQRTAKGWRNLTVDNTQRACWLRADATTASTTADMCTTDDRTFYPATHFRYNGGDVELASSYTRVEIKPGNAPFAGGAGRSDCANPSACTYAEEIRNFANWYSYHRSRVLASQAGIGRAFAQLPTRMRIGYGAINKGVSSVDGVDTATVVRGVRRFEGADREEFFDLLYGRDMPLAGTPLRRALDDAGQYFSRTDARGPWSSTPGSTGGSELACRQSFTVLMTDGAWNGDAAGTAAAQANNDGSAGTTITGPGGASYTYAAAAPFTDTRANTLADVAMHYWKRDLRGDLANRVPASTLNPAFWQHMVTFGVALGVHGNIDPEAAFAAIGTASAIDWPDPLPDNAAAAKLDDLLHSAVNGRGGFFSAGDPGAFADGLAGVLRDVVARTGAVTGLTVSSTRLTTGSNIYAAEFSSEDWSGDLRAHAADDHALAWSAAERLADLGADQRNIHTWHDGNGIAFDAGLPAAAKLRLVAGLGLPAGDPATLVRAESLIDWLRGSQLQEQQAGGPWRDRTALLGDIVHSRPQLSSKGNEGWARLPVAQGGGTTGPGSYGRYIDEVKRDPRECTGEPGCVGERYDTLFVGANDGMLHAFDARTGDELFAYVPGALHDGLHQLASPGYGHRWYVDGDVTVADARLGGQWRTVLVGSLGGGGRGIYALDVTHPQGFDSGDVLWEFTSADDPDLGYTFGEPAITRLPDGTWVAVFGNGYNSASGRNHLFVLDLATGAVRHKIALGTAVDNGLSGVAVSLDAASRAHAERLYVGDLRGTMWRVDFNIGGAAVRYPGGLFTDPGNRPITVRPSLAASPRGGMMVYFGTGKLIEAADRALSSPPLERFWAVRDADVAIANTSLAGFAEVTLAETDDGVRTATPSGSDEKGWYVRLRDAGGNRGERVLNRAQVFFGRVLFSTYQPVEDPCTPGGLQRLYVLNAMSGGGAYGGGDGGGGASVGAREIGSGAPVDPPVVITPRPPATPGDGGLDPDDPSDPDDPDHPGTPPADATGGRSGWCSILQVPLPGGGFQSLGTICDGRQSWRQAR
jgi:type IV pilus assembly protein PilY1